MNETLIHLGRLLRNGTLEHLPTAKIQTRLRVALSGQDLRCLPTKYRDRVEDIELIANILTRRVAIQTGLGHQHSYIIIRAFLTVDGRLVFSCHVVLSGKVGINLAASWYQPKTSSEPEVSKAVERAFQFQLGWFAEPILLTGDYPNVMKKQIANKSMTQGVPNRVPVFTDKEKKIVKGTCICLLS